MAIRKQIIVDGQITHHEAGATYRDILTGAQIENPPSLVIGGEVITAADYDRQPPPQYREIRLNQTAISKGDTLRNYLLDKEFDLIARFLGQFEGIPRSLELDEHYLLIRGFPLNNDYLPNDHINLLLVTVGYPDVPPSGVYIPSKTVNREKITQHLGGHVRESFSDFMLHHIPEKHRKQVAEYTNPLAEKGWSWICYHYKDWTWRLNPNNLLSGDCIAKFVENVFAALSGGHK